MGGTWDTCPVARLLGLKLSPTGNRGCISTRGTGSMYLEFLFSAERWQHPYSSAKLSFGEPQLECWCGPGVKAPYLMLLDRDDFLEGDQGPGTKVDRRHRGQSSGALAASSQVTP